MSPMTTEIIFDVLPIYKNEFNELYFWKNILQYMICSIFLRTFNWKFFYIYVYAFQNILRTFYYFVKKTRFCSWSMKIIKEVSPKVTAPFPNQTCLQQLLPRLPRSKNLSKEIEFFVYLRRKLFFCTREVENRPRRGGV